LDVFTRRQVAKLLPTKLASGGKAWNARYKYPEPSTRTNFRALSDIIFPQEQVPPAPEPG